VIVSDVFLRRDVGAVVGVVAAADCLRMAFLTAAGSVRRVAVGFEFLAGAGGSDVALADRLGVGVDFLTVVFLTVDFLRADFLAVALVTADFLALVGGAVFLGAGS
jgi:hypothetical protein